MKFTKKDLISLLGENLKEMAMDFDSEDRPDQGIQDKLAQGDTSFKDVPLPDTNDENKNFQEILASERYKQVVAKVREYTGVNTPMNGQSNITPLAQTMMSAHNQIIQIESQHKEALERLAVELVMQEMQLDEDEIVLNAKLVGMGEISTEDFNREVEENQDVEMEEIEIDLMNDLENLSLEKAKRRLINSIIQGASKKGHYMYHNVADKLSEITGNPNIINLDGVLMSINDTLYWQLSDDTMKMMMGGGQGGGEGMVGGKEKVDTSVDPPVVNAEAINFPILVHELIKGVMEVLAVHGRPEDQDVWSQVESSEDTLEKEMWDLRLGPSIWQRIRSQFPDEVLMDENLIRLQNFLLIEIFKLPAKEFLVFMKETLTGSERGKQLMSELMSAVQLLFNDADYQEAMSRFNSDLDDASDGIDDDELGDFLGSLGIDMSDDDE